MVGEKWHMNNNVAGTPGSWSPRYLSRCAAAASSPACGTFRPDALPTYGHGAPCTTMQDLCDGVGNGPGSVAALDLVHWHPRIFYTRMATELAWAMR